MQQVDTLLASLDHILQVSYASTGYSCDLHTLQGSTSSISLNCMCHKFWQSLQADLKGTRTIQSLTDVVQAMACAFPLQLSAALDTAQHELAAQHAAEVLLPRLWMQHAVHDGSLSTLVGSLRTQPQVKRQENEKCPTNSDTSFWAPAGGCSLPEKCPTQGPRLL